MSLVDLVDNTRTDKNTGHSYLEIYEKLIAHKKDTAKNILEIGIFQGGSIKLWYDYFQNATIHAIDIMDMNYVWPEIRNKQRIKLYTSTNAYNPYFIMNNLFRDCIKFDMIIDDGPHTLESQKDCVFHYSHLLANDGVMIIEDLPFLEWADELKKVTPSHLQEFIEVYDRRPIKGRHDDILFVINCSKPKNQSQ
jgi:hypothetical protein